MPDKRTYTYKTIDGCELLVDVYLPEDTGRAPVRGTMLWVHGGALICGDRRVPQEHAERYVRAGYAVISPEYRLAPETKLPALIDDLRDAHRWIGQASLLPQAIDLSRLVVVGHSAGGYLALMTGFCVQPRPRAIVSFYGYGDLTSPCYSRPDAYYGSLEAIPRERAMAAVGTRPVPGSADGERSQFYRYCRQRGTWPTEVADHDPNTEPGWFIPFAPVRNVTRDYPPTLLLHGDQDTDVPYELSVQMAAELQRHSVRHELITMHGQGHGFPVGEEIFARVLGFLNSTGA